MSSETTAVTAEGSSMAHRVSWVNQHSLSDPHASLASASETRRKWRIVLVYACKIAAERLDDLERRSSTVCKRNSSRISLCYGGLTIKSSGQGSSAAGPHNKNRKKGYLLAFRSTYENHRSCSELLCFERWGCTTFGVVAPLTLISHIMSEGNQ